MKMSRRGEQLRQTLVSIVGLTANTVAELGYCTTDVICHVETEEFASQGGMNSAFPAVSCHWQVLWAG